MNRYTMFGPAALLLVGVLLVSGVREQYVVQPLEPVTRISGVMSSYATRDIEIDSVERRVAGMSQYMYREFLRDSALAFSVYVGYYDRQVQGKTIHSPKNCLPGAGWEILTSSKVPLPGSVVGGTANRVVLANKGTRALVYYWYQGRGREESSEYRVKWDLLRDAALHGRTEEALVRIVVPVGRAPEGTMPRADDRQVLEADELARQVASELTPAVTRVLPKFPGA